MNNIDFCIECESTFIEKVTKPEEFNIRGDRITVEVTYYHCKDCGVNFEDLNDDNDYLDTAYRIYREKHNMLQPEDIKELRKKYNLTQGELANILGWGPVTLSRYENGALQDSVHDKMLKLLKEPFNLYVLLTEAPDTLEEKKYKELMDKLISPEEYFLSEKLNKFLASKYAEKLQM